MHFATRSIHPMGLVSCVLSVSKSALIPASSGEYLSVTLKPKCSFIPFPIAVPHILHHDRGIIKMHRMWMVTRQKGAVILFKSRQVALWRKQTGVWSIGSGVILKERADKGPKIKVETPKFLATTSILAPKLLREWVENESGIDKPSIETSCDLVGVKIF
jgi:hypothetical protein